MNTLMGPTCWSSPFGVAQIGNLPYRRLAIGRVPTTPTRAQPVETLQDAILRHSRLPVCATKARNAANGFSWSAWMRGSTSLPGAWPMFNSKRNWVGSAICLIGICFSLGFAASPIQAALAAEKTSSQSKPTIDFQRDVRPILSGHCFQCHGPDQNARKANLRLDVREEALRPAKSGQRPIVPGKPEESRLVQRTFSKDDDEVMPPPETKRPLSDAQKEILQRWIAEGAEYTAHWAFIPPRQSPPPKVKLASWPRNGIDYFILDRLEREGLAPSPAADRYTLVRRLYLDLIGLPPTPEEADAFVRDESSDAYEKLVDQLLGSPHYGERWARRWLDLARYADTNGYEKDRRRSIWPYRDWVIQALNADMPFDQFTIEQIAGDMLPNATRDQRIATGFHRNTMLNEEGGIDPLEFHFYSTVDRVSTTATTWLGLTMGCAQCHTHKFDPIPHQEYYQFLALLNNADEPEIEVPTPEMTARRAELEKKIAGLISDLPNRFPVEEFRWHPQAPLSVASDGGVKSEKLDDQSIRFSGTSPDKDAYALEFETEIEAIAAIKLEVLSDSVLPKTGPGRSVEGDAVLSEITVKAAPRSALEQIEPVKLASARADFTTGQQPASQAIDGKSETGWLIKKAIRADAIRVATFRFEKPVKFPGGTRWTIRLEQQAGKKQTFGRVRLSFGTRLDDSRPIEVRRREHLEKKFRSWQEQEGARAVRWTILRPLEARSNLPLLTILEDGSVLASGDQTKRDLYQLKFRTELRGITALRLEALPDERLPKRGPGRVFYEGVAGDFFLSELTASTADQPVKFNRATQSFASGQNSAATAIDGDPQSGWMINGGQGRAHTAVFNLATPLENADNLSIQLLFERYHAAGLGRFKISATTSERSAEALDLPSGIEDLLVTAPEKRSFGQRQQLLDYFVSIGPDLAEERQELENLRQQIPAFPTTLVMAERPPENPRPTSLHKRGEFLQAAERVEPDVPSVLPPLPKEAPRNRLTLARWLVDPRNPLVGRVVVNRQWAALFGAGLVRTVQDFGFQGEVPSHPELLDWLAVELVNQGWSIKKVHRLIVTSATYRQSSQATAERLEKDPQNRLLARGPRVRLEAELIRDLALRVSGLYAPKIGGPSVFPPQPPGVSTEGAYGPLEWKVSDGADRYRRGLYTFSKRTAPYAMFTTFDAPTGEACIARREVSNTPLQSLALLNDVVFVETAQALGRMIAAQRSDDQARAAYLFRRCLTRPPDADDLASLFLFYRTQKARFEKKELDAAALAGAGDGDVNERAAWTAAARALLNLDETITKN
jgi:hypothetical protein